MNSLSALTVEQMQNDASKSKMNKESTNAKCANFWRERMQRRGFCNLENVGVTVVTLT